MCKAWSKLTDCLWSLLFSVIQRNQQFTDLLELCFCHSQLIFLNYCKGHTYNQTHTQFSEKSYNYFIESSRSLNWFWNEWTSLCPVSFGLVQAGVCIVSFLNEWVYAGFLWGKSEVLFSVSVFWTIENLHCKHSHTIDLSELRPLNVSQIATSGHERFNEPRWPS